MKGLAELVLSFCDLLEAEGRSLRQSVKRTGLGCALTGVGALFIGVALAFLTGAIYDLLTGLVPRPVAFVILAGASFVFAFGLLWSAQKCVKTIPPKNRPKA